MFQLLISLFWFIREIKAILFWIYLWQLKEYYFSRLFDHFRTAKGKNIFLNFLQYSKIFLIFLSFIFPLIFFVILNFLYFGEVILFLKNLFQRKLIKPIFTKKAILIFFSTVILITIILIFLYINIQDLNRFSFKLLLIDIFTPILVSLVVFFFQPFTNLVKSQIIKKAKEKRKKLKNLIVIGIVGSYGKTSTKEFLATILSEKFKVLTTPSHQNTDMAIAQLILNKLDETIEVFIVEMAAYKKGEITSPCQIVRPKIGIVTGVNEQHLATFGSMENLLSAEGGKELIESLPKDGIAIFNGENLYCFELYQKTKISKRICTINRIFDENAPLHSDIWVENLKVEKEYLSFKVFSKNSKETVITLPRLKYLPQDSAEFRVNLLGAQNVENILLAACCAKELGMTLKEIADACLKIKPEQGGIVLKRGINELNIIDATYSANPNSVISHLEYLKIWPGKKIIIMPCLIELGKASKEVHKKIGQKIGEVCDLAIITTKERFKEIKGEAGEKAIFLENPQKIFEKIKTFSSPEDVVLLESRLPQRLIDQLLKGA